MPANTDIASLYDFEGVMEKALAALFTANDVKAFTSQWIAKTGDKAADAANEAAGFSLLDWQLDTPRVEIFFTPGAGAGQFTNKVIGGVEMPVETSWSGQYRLDLKTTADIRKHAAFRTLGRYLLHTQLLSVNGNALALHHIATFPKDAGTTPMMKGENGFFQTTFLYDIEFSIQDDAWDTLAT